MARGQEEEGRTGKRVGLSSFWVWRSTSGRIRELVVERGMRARGSVARPCSELAKETRTRERATWIVGAH